MNGGRTSIVIAAVVIGVAFGLGSYTFAYARGWSYMTDDPKAAKSPCPVGTLDWGGAWGHNWIIDRTNKLTIAVLTNTAPEGCNGPFREEVRDAVYASL